MPSGAKKRKAARKKKENVAHINQSTNSTQGSHELKSQDDKETDDDKGTDGGEFYTPASHDPDNHQHPFNGGNEEVEEGDSSAAEFFADVKSVEEVPSDAKNSEMVGGQQDSVVNVVIERELKSEESYHSVNVSVEHIDSSKESRYEDSNSIDTSNDEFVTEKNSKKNQEAITCDDLVQSVDSSSAKMIVFTENAQVKENDNSVVESSVVSSVMAIASGSEVKSSDAESAAVENIMVPAPAATDLAVKKDEDKVYLLSENVRTSSLEEPKPKDDDNKVLGSLSGNPLIESTEGTEHIKDSKTPECSEHETLVASAPRVIQRTSWLNCCGLFEVLSGSQR